MSALHHLQLLVELQTFSRCCIQGASFFIFTCLIDISKSCLQSSRSTFRYIQIICKLSVHANTRRDWYLCVGTKTASLYCLTLTTLQPVVSPSPSPLSNHKLLTCVIHGFEWYALRYISTYLLLTLLRPGVTDRAGHGSHAGPGTYLLWPPQSRGVATYMRVSRSFIPTSGKSSGLFSSLLTITPPPTQLDNDHRNDRQQPHRWHQPHRQQCQRLR